MWYIGVLCVILLGLLGVLAWVSFRPQHQHTSLLSTSPIPRIIHQVWPGDSDLPEWARLCSHTWREHHPGFEYRLHRHDDCVSFLREHYPSSTLQIYLDMDTQERAELMRCLLLHQYGGVYVNIDTVCLRSIETLLQHRDRLVAAIEFTGSSAQVLPWAFATRPRHPVFLGISKEVLARHLLPASTRRSFSHIFTDHIMKAYRENSSDVTMHEHCTPSRDGTSTPECLKKAYLVHHPQTPSSLFWQEHLRKLGDLHKS